MLFFLSNLGAALRLLFLFYRGTERKGYGSMQSDMPAQRREFEEVMRAVMPFGRYKGKRLIDLPERYLIWFAQKGFPAGRLGERLQLVYEIKRNGLERMCKSFPDKRTKDI